MSLTLTVLLSLLSAGLLAGRVYEILVLTDAQTGFLFVGGIVFNPYVLAVFAVIAVCCGILIFGSINTVKPYYSKASRYTAALAGAALVAAGVLSLSTDKVSMFIIAGGLALLVIAFAGLGKKKTDYLAIVLLLVFTAGLCMDVIAFDVYTIYNTAFMQKALAYITAIAFMLYVLKNVYIPSSTSRMILYILGMLAFAFCSMMSLADTISFVVQNGSFDVKLVNDIAFVLFGLYAFDNAISVVPTKKEIKTAKAVQNMPVLLNPEMENDEPEEKAEDAESVLAFAEETE
ncbi:MAG: hypothetical protein IJW74_06945 [Oscillospiraceae bacterium]|nr:hypothetical protein [Oscillospiraceae bacterium]